MKKTPKAFFALAAIVISALGVGAQTKITTPKEQFGFSLGDDYQLANSSRSRITGTSWTRSRTAWRSRKLARPPKDART